MKYLVIALFLLWCLYLSVRVDRQAQEIATLRAMVHMHTETITDLVSRKDGGK